jgi:glycosyltransferase involved in cell wall biosynthesis
MTADHRSTVDVLIHCPGSHGAIPDQVHKQASALHELGIKVLVLCSLGYLRTRAAEYPVMTCMSEGATQGSGIFSRKVSKTLQTIRNQWIFAWEVYSKRPVIVLTGSHTDTQSALWIWPHIFLSHFQKVVYITNLHFSARDHTLGPKWWNDLSSRLSFSPFRIAVAHKRQSATTQLPSYIQPVEVPLGPERITPIRENPKTIRSRWKVPRGKKVFLAFGTIRNHKNIDLAIRALMDNPDAHLVILGCVSSHKDKPMKYYQMLANDLGLSNRVFISDEFVADEKRLCYFQAADYILLTYSGSFHSQTATLTTAVNARRLVLASSGDSPMEDLVRFFGIGVYVEPDSSDAVADGMATLLHGKLPEPDWDGYEAHATWETNVTYMLQATSDYLSGRIPQKRQFEGLEDQAQAIPELLNARRINNQKTPPKKVRAAAAKKPSARKKIQPQSASQVSNKNANGHVSENGVNGHPTFPGFEMLDSAKRGDALDSAGPATTGERPLLGVEKGKKVSPQRRKRIESEAVV